MIMDVLSELLGQTVFQHLWYFLYRKSLKIYPNSRLSGLKLGSKLLKINEILCFSSLMPSKRGTGIITNSVWRIWEGFLKDFRCQTPPQTLPKRSQERLKNSIEKHHIFTSVFIMIFVDFHVKNHWCFSEFPFVPAFKFTSKSMAFLSYFQRLF